MLDFVYIGSEGVCGGGGDWGFWDVQGKCWG